jgi:2-octaprenyl-6-methoxyphenol hydroxylase
MSQEREFSIAIIGAGPVGLSLSLLLAKQGHSVTLFDGKSQEATLADLRTLALSHGSRELLEKLGAWPASAAVPISDIVISQQASGLSALASTHLNAQHHKVPALGYTVRYGELVGILQAQTTLHEAQITTRYSTKVDDPQALEDTHDLTVICEGGAFAAQDRKPLHRDYGQLAYIATVKAAQFKAGHAYERFTPQGPLAFLPLRDAYSMVWCRAELSAAQREDVAWCESEINAAFGSSLGKLSIASPLIGVPLGLNAHWQLVNAKHVTIGNAAQTLHPVAGQGFNLGLRDAWVLASLLAQHHDVSTALKHYPSERTADRSAMMMATDFLARSFTWQLPGAAPLRAAGLAAMTVLPGAKQALASWMMRGLR